MSDLRRKLMLVFQCKDFGHTKENGDFVTSPQKIGALKDAVEEAIAVCMEEAAKVAERDVDWSRFGKGDLQQWENGPDSIRDYRLGIASGRAIAAALRALRGEGGVDG